MDDSTVDENRQKHEDDCNKVLSGGPWVIFGQYLIVHPWLSMFSMSQNEVDIQVVRIRRPNFPEGYYSHLLLRAIGQAIGPIIKLDKHTNNARRGMFARLVACIDLKKHLVSKVQINGHTQHMEYEPLPNFFFRCGLYGHSSNSCMVNRTPSLRNGIDHSVLVVEEVSLQRRVEEESYSPWMLVDHRQRRKCRRMRDTMNEDDDNLFGGSYFTSLDENHGGIESEILTHNKGV
ncbi:hypothetical protein GOBAR_AA27359 [Gossypium barbadense]|uniref:Uncharacterized protein n=1 Tax=Gossypium barbadense TaxID=3634 RepID=A0A2P5WQH8_GOSBA|nr:hypothetical protein GOBAR_AA27359 [Gossypium barbadense]